MPWASQEPPQYVWKGTWWEIQEKENWGLSWRPASTWLWNRNTGIFRKSTCEASNCSPSSRSLDSADLGRFRQSNPFMPDTCSMDGLPSCSFKVELWVAGTLSCHLISVSPRPRTVTSQVGYILWVVSKCWLTHKNLIRKCARFILRQSIIYTNMYMHTYTHVFVWIHTYTFSFSPNLDIIIKEFS